MLTESKVLLTAKLDPIMHGHLKYTGTDTGIVTGRYWYWYWYW